MERRDSVEIKGKFLQGFKVTEILGESYEGIFVETWILKFPQGRKRRSRKLSLGRDFITSYLRKLIIWRESCVVTPIEYNEVAI